MTTVYVIVEAHSTYGDVAGCLMLNTGEVLWSHMSSDEVWLKRDLTDGFTDRKERLAALYPDGYEIKFVRTEADWPDGLIELNELWAAQQNGEATS